MYKNSLTFELLTANGSRITEFNRDGNTYVEGRKGSSYKIKLTNHSHRRIKAVVSVDGLDVIEGKRATDQSRAYVLDGYNSMTIDGWRISNDEIREFFFSKRSGSYNTKTSNDTDNIGVIGVKAFYQREYRPPIQSNYLLSGHYGGYGARGISFDTEAGNLSCYWSGAPTASMNSMEVKTSVKRLKAAAEPTSLGTGMGNVKNSPVREVSFDFETTPFVTSVIYYKTAKELQAMGINVVKPTQKPLPSAFGNYCKQV